VRPNDIDYRTMLSQSGTLIVLGLLVVLGIAAILLSITILCRGKLYHRLKPDARPRRWVLILLLVLFLVFIIWFPVWMTWPHALISRFLTLLFGLSFAVVCLTARWLSPLVDAFVERKGWPLR
jgi:H+/Cl- antiporter ClcA